MKAFTVGDTVTIHDPNGPCAIGRVAQVLKRKTVLDDHSQWQGIGQPAHEFSKWPKRHISLMVETDRDVIARRELASAIARIQVREWMECSIGLLNLIVTEINGIRAQRKREEK